MVGHLFIVKKVKPLHLLRCWQSANDLSAFIQKLNERSTICGRLDR
jgi:hypothetical protein